MTFQTLLDSQAFFHTFLKQDVFFNSLKQKFPEILADLTSSRNNPNCSCKNRVKTFLESKINSEGDYFNNLINIEEIKKLISEKNEEIVSSQIPRNNLPNFLNPMQNIYKNGGGKIFEIGKTEQDWMNLAKKLIEERVHFKSFSVIEKEDKLVVYFI
jgi:hypothetical protein